MTSLAVASALVVRIVALVELSGKALVLDSWRDWILVFLYYWLMENAPAMVRGAGGRGRGCMG